MHYDIQWQKLNAELACCICNEEFTVVSGVHENNRTGTTHRCGPNLARNAPPTPHGSSSVIGRTPVPLHENQLTDSTHWARQDPRTLFDEIG
jgi:hypothetical protein